MQQSFTKANLPVNLRNKPEQVQELFLKTANDHKNRRLQPPIFHYQYVTCPIDHMLGSIL